MLKDLKKICDPEVFEDVFNLYGKDLRRFLFFKTKDIDTAEDILQDTFIKLWENCDTVNYSSVKGFLYTVANNLFLNSIKRNKVKQNIIAQLGSNYNLESPDFVLEEKEFLIKIEQTIASLPEKQREVFLMNRIEKKKYKEISELLDISVKAVEKRMHQALIIMRKEIGNV
ncbi:RNA polymerase sigma-70 factor [Ichthyenterobacterium sp. W332]|uniref:RNA polymerase sigma-70 factor n=1 Tax=Microcosmobacter mediterraneus TaxID=3075607 RepID=A0ABU2YG14_9FLAO|nr:RNA polymerase sigma-70 factor [Ichthyenterobacterium sp. W332]MDT0557123.1 RNA polymerase sigma-70 factor [Ichthyenterobacterium sp. W332]